MSPAPRNFKSRIIGGFDRQDVMTYIEELAGQRNRYKARNAELEEKVSELQISLDLARRELEEANTQIREIKVTALADAAASLDVLQQQYDAIRAEMDEAAARMRNELSLVSDMLTHMATVLDVSGARFAELRRIIGDELSGLSAEE